MNFKKLVLAFVLGLALPIVASAHSVSLSFTKSVDDLGAVGSGYTAWRLSGSCPASVTTTAGFTSLNSALFTTNTFNDQNIVPGTYCYVVTFSTSTSTSSPSNTAAATVQPAPPSGVVVTTVAEIVVQEPASI